MNKLGCVAKVGLYRMNYRLSWTHKLEVVPKETRLILYSYQFETLSARARKFTSLVLYCRKFYIWVFATFFLDFYFFL